ncbi:hypothetical protein HKD37_10G028076 [Glycine soja]
MMGTNQNGKRFYQVKIKGLDVTSLKELGRLMGSLQRQAFRKVYGKILDLTTAEVFTEAIVSLAQYYELPLRCFSFGDFQIVPTVEEFEEILGCPIGGRKPYLFSGFLPSLSKIATVVGDLARELDHRKQTRNGVVGLQRKYLEGKARDMANQEEWVPFADILALLIFGVVLFPNVDGLVDLAAIDAFLAYHHSKESPVVAMLVDLFDTFDRRCEKNSARIVCCLPALSDEVVQAQKSELGKARLAKEKFKSAATSIRKECAELREENATTAKALEQETKRARKEEYGQDKFGGALWDSNNELKLRREERDQSRVHGMILKEELAVCSRSKRSLAQHLEATERSMLAIIGQYKEGLNQSLTHEKKLVEDFAQAYAEKEARGRVIDALHQEATIWMDRFAFTLNGSQDLPRLLAKAKAIAEVCSAPEEIHGLINYCQHMIDLMAHIIRNR